MNAALFMEILPVLSAPVHSAQELRLHQSFVFQHDNDPKNTAKIMKEWFGDINLLEWPSQSPDLNPTKNLCTELQRRVHAQSPKPLVELETYCLEEWDNIPSQSCAKYCNDYKKRLLEVITNKSHSIYYLC